jgi:GT2 family glycosyltransferase
MLASIVILNYNGKPLLRRVVQSALSVNWQDLEVIIIDNASSDGSAEEIEAEFGGKVRTIQRSVNSATAGRNQGFWEAKGEIILSIDNDIILPDRDIIAKAMTVFEELPHVGALACKITEEGKDEPLKEHWWFPLPIDMAKHRFYSDYVCEGAAFLRRKAVLKSGGYDEDFGWGFEAVDFALNLLRSGWEIVFCPELWTNELRIRRDPHASRNMNSMYSLRNRLWTAWKHYPLSEALWYGATRMGIAFIRASRGGWIDMFFRATWTGLFAPAVIRQKRSPLPAAVRKRIGEIRRGEFVGDQESESLKAKDLVGTPPPYPSDL